ncbi:MAG TPA: hypothetical protein VGS22_26750 [Thermoanaerobaculia bacterium]|jgi:hypothetical protein|nr:hypothetical protein [Thermoanaerobaculia bacterium]
MTEVAAPSAPSRGFAQGLGLLLFLFIPLVLFLFVRHPKPLVVSLAAGLVLIVAHRAVARPWAARVRGAKCLWCNRMLTPGTPAAQAVDLELNAGTERLAARCCPEHRAPAAKFFSWLDRAKAPLRLGIFLPLLALLAALAAAALGHGRPLPLATALFQLIVGLTVNLGAWGYLGQKERAPLAVPFPAHNFFLLGVRNLLWIFRGVGIWWIWVGARGLIAG